MTAKRKHEKSGDESRDGVIMTTLPNSVPSTEVTSGKMAASIRFKTGAAAKVFGDFSSFSTPSTSKMQHKMKETTMKCNFEMIRFIHEAGSKLVAKPLTIATASCIFHRFYENMPRCHFDKQLVAGVSLYLAGKVEENHLKIRDVINVCHRMVHRNNETLRYGEEYFELRDSFVRLELLMLRFLRFDVNFAHPHKYLLHYFWSLSRWLDQDIWQYAAVLRAAWSFVQDLLHDPAYLQHKPQHVAVAAIYLALECYGVEVPCHADTNTPWYEALVDDMDENKVWKLVEVIIKNYKQETLAPERK